MKRSKKVADEAAPHWLEKAEPKYAPLNDLWRVRLMRKGQKYNWWLKSGKGDASSTGKILAITEWNEIKRKIRADEEGIKVQLGVQRDGSFKVLSDDIFDADGKVNDGDYVESFTNQEEYKRVLRREIYRKEYLSSPFAERMTLDDYLDWLDFQEERRQQQPLSADAPRPQSEPAEPRSIRHLLDAFETALKLIQESTIRGLDDGAGMGKSRLEQYQYSIAHMKKHIGQIVSEPLGTYSISDLQLEQVLEKYRDECKREVAEYQKEKWRGRGGHWFNEKMKAARKWATFLVEKRLCNNVPPRILHVTKKYTIKATAHPIPLHILRTIWNLADGKFKTYMLIALNLGFRQTEISLLDWEEQHIVVEAGKLIVDKDRGKTGVPIKIPLWKITDEFIKRYANKTGKFFEFEGNAEKAAIECIGKRWNKLRRQAAKTHPEAENYNFENLRDTGASFLRSKNPLLVPLYLGQTTKGDMAAYISEIKDEQGKGIIPMYLDTALEAFLDYLKLS